MEDRLLPLNNQVHSEHFSGSNRVTITTNRRNSRNNQGNKDSSDISVNTKLTCDTDLVSRISSDQTSTSETMTEVKIINLFISTLTTHNISRIY